MLRAWDDVHRPIRNALNKTNDPELDYRLGRHIKHLNNHIQAVERLLRKFGA